jgi:hypothetical protein
VATEEMLSRPRVPHGPPTVLLAGFAIQHGGTGRATEATEKGQTAPRIDGRGPTARLRHRQKRATRVARRRRLRALRGPPCFSVLNQNRRRRRDPVQGQEGSNQRPDHPLPLTLVRFTAHVGRGEGRRNAGYFTSAGSATLAFLNAGITSSPKRCNCSSASDFGTPTERLTDTRSSAGYFSSSAFR